MNNQYSYYYFYFAISDPLLYINIQRHKTEALETKSPQGPLALIVRRTYPPSTKLNRHCGNVLIFMGEQTGAERHGGVYGGDRIIEKFLLAIEISRNVPLFNLF